MVIDHCNKQNFFIYFSPFWVGTPTFVNSL